MSRRPATANKTSLYRLTMPASGLLQDCLQQKYVDDGFEAIEVKVGDVPGLLVHGVIPNLSPRWLPHVKSLVGLQPEVYNYTSAAVLLVPFQGFVYALSWGFGHLIISPRYIDSGFGLRFAIRRANPAQVRSLTTHTMDTLARTARTSVPGGAALEAFGMEEIGELVSRLVGRIPAAALAAERGGGTGHITIRGSDALNIPLGLKPDALLADLQVVHDVVRNERPVEGLEHFEHTTPLRPRHPLLQPLADDLAEVLTPDTTARIALSWPAQWEEEHGEASRYRITGISRGRPEETDEMELNDLLAPIGERPPEQRLTLLKRITIQGLDGDGNAITRAIPGDRWVTFETDRDGQRYVFYQGRWFNIGGAYLDMLRAKVARIFERMSDLTLPPWPQERKQQGSLGPVAEGTYNLTVQTASPDFLCLDRKLIYTEQHPRGIEACDVFGPDDELIHVKRLDDSVSASHLFNQAIVSAEALRRDPVAQQRFRERVEEVSEDRRKVPADFRPRRVVLAFAGRRAAAEALFTFSQVTLVRCDQRLGELDVELRIAEIEDLKE